MENFLHVGDGFIIVYSMTDRKSYITIPRYKEMIEESRDCTIQGPPSIVLIGNKTDLEEHRTVAKRKDRHWPKDTGGYSAKLQLQNMMAWMSVFTM